MEKIIHRYEKRFNKKAQENGNYTKHFIESCINLLSFYENEIVGYELGYANIKAQLME
jgi:hypothetical protein